ncbi:class I SAM-dependent methyltransferase [Pseudoalteromonas rubra]|uniref:class I SAM-dependent methyltransferase n=1 Tax=Pseudoalteromonas rubra TaxID=43658 RepID=UPI000F7B9C16|nr:class I SAM-dependent methyltransferase [Pseudoalteromonas rubra]
MLKPLFTQLCVGCLSLASLAVSGTSFAMTDPLDTAVNNQARSDGDLQRDSNRLPVQTLQFFGLTPDMRVLELMPGKGWYTRILAATLNEQGELYTAIRTGGVEKSLSAIQKDFGAVSVVPVEAQRTVVNKTPTYHIQAFDLPVQALDMALSFRNYHNLTEQSRKHVNDAVFNALKPGGVYALVDHTRRHMESDSNENRRRVDPVKVIKEVQQSGFVLADYSDLHFRADDELRYEVGRKSVSGNTDRFTLKFIKPVN